MRNLFFFFPTSKIFPLFLDRVPSSILKIYKFGKFLKNPKEFSDYESLRKKQLLIAKYIVMTTNKDYEYLEEKSSLILSKLIIYKDINTIKYLINHEANIDMFYIPLEIDINSKDFEKIKKLFKIK